jgi:hypothetical protein
VEGGFAGGTGGFVAAEESTADVVGLDAETVAPSELMEFTASVFGGGAEEFGGAEPLGPVEVDGEKVPAGLVEAEVFGTAALLV